MSTVCHTILMTIREAEKELQDDITAYMSDILHKEVIDHLCWLVANNMKKINEE
mgnify:CR=1 FL=1